MLRVFSMVVGEMYKFCPIFWWIVRMRTLPLIRGILVLNPCVGSSTSSPYFFQCSVEISRVRMRWSYSWARSQGMQLGGVIVEVAILGVSLAAPTG